MLRFFFLGKMPIIHFVVCLLLDIYCRLLDDGYVYSYAYVLRGNTNYLKYDSSDVAHYENIYLRHLLGTITNKANQENGVPGSHIL